MRVSVRAALIALIALVAIGGLFGTGVISTVSKPIDSTTASAAGFCTEAGVSLLVETGESDTIIACAKNFSDTGWQLFAATNQQVEGTSEYPVGFVCRINDFPSDSTESCTGTPTAASGSWAYYFASSETGNHWMLSGVGAATRKPKCGDVDGWVFIAPGELLHEPKAAPVTFQCKH